MASVDGPTSSIGLSLLAVPLGLLCLSVVTVGEDLRWAHKGRSSNGGSICIRVMGMRIVRVRSIPKLATSAAVVPAAVITAATTAVVI